MDQKVIEDIAHLMVGDHPAWQARFADAVGISRTHMSNVMNGKRPITTDFMVRVYTACRDQAASLHSRAGQLEGYAGNIRKLVPAVVDEPPVSYTRADYDADAEEAEKIIADLAGVPKGES